MEKGIELHSDLIVVTITLFSCNAYFCSILFFANLYLWYNFSVDVLSLVLSDIIDTLMHDRFKRL